MKRAESQALRSIAQLHRELAEAYERLATAGDAPGQPTTPAPRDLPRNFPAPTPIDQARADRVLKRLDDRRRVRG